MAVVKENKNFHSGTEVLGGWSAWKDEVCSSGCLSKSKGAVEYFVDIFIQFI